MALAGVLLAFIGWFIFLSTKVGFKGALIEVTCGLINKRMIGHAATCVGDFKNEISLFLIFIASVTIISLFYRYIYPKKSPF